MISIYKTDLCMEHDLGWLDTEFRQISHIQTWNVDFEDEDNILRIESTTGISPQVIEVFRNYNFNCIELE